MTVYKTLDDGYSQYDIVVRSMNGTCQTYRTRRLISDAGGTYLHGRATRVWEAVRLEKGVETDEIVALKDSWVDEYRDREASINARVREAGTSQEERDKLGEMIMQVVAYGDVHIADVPDRTRTNVDGELTADHSVTSSDFGIERPSVRRAASSSSSDSSSSPPAGPQIHTPRSSD